MNTLPKVLDQEVNQHFALYNADCVEAIEGIPDNSIHLSIYSPPFANLYTYSESPRDAGNSFDDAEFMRHYGYLLDDLYRVTVPGRLSVVHCKQLVNYKGRDGIAGLRDFRGEIIKAHVERGWAYHSEVTIWTDPVLEMERTKAHGLLWKQLRADSSFSRQGLPEYLCIFRKWPKDDAEAALIEPITHTMADYPLERWQADASPVWQGAQVWMDIQRTNVLNVRMAREEDDEKHLCPLQLDCIERALRIWSNPGDVVLDPFAGIGSVGVVSIQQGRRFAGVELKDAYYRQALKYLHEAVFLSNQPTLFDLATV